jgi:hypothetical protein
MQGAASGVTQAQLVFVCQRTRGWLQELCMARRLYGQMPIQDLSPLSSCTRLTALDLSFHFEIKDLAPLSTVSGLRELQLSRTSIRSIETLASLSQLSYLDICSTRVASLAPLSSLTGLEVLNLSNCRQITSLVPLSPFPACWT